MIGYCHEYVDAAMIRCHGNPAADPLQNIEQMREVRLVMKDGRIHKHPDLLEA